MTKPLDEQGVQRAMAAVFATWVEPELRRRIEEGRLPHGFRLEAFQLITDDAGVPCEVRLNEEVRAALRRRTRREVEKDDVVLGDATVDVPELLLTAADPNAGHFTAVQTGDGGWLTSIDVRVNARRAADHGEAAREFLNAAGASLKGGNLRAFAENLFGASELMAKAYLLTVPGSNLGRRHGSVAGPFNLERRAGRVHESFAALLNRLTDLRSSGRYLSGDFALDAAEAAQMMATGEAMYRALYDVVPKRFPAPAAASDDAPTDE